MAAFRDLRDYIDRLRQQLGDGTVVTIDGAHWDREIGCISELVAEREGPALLFDNIAGYPAGFRVFTNFMGTPAACALALGLPLDLPKLEIVRAGVEGKEQTIAAARAARRGGRAGAAKPTRGRLPSI